MQGLKPSQIHAFIILSIVSLFIVRHLSSNSMVSTSSQEVYQSGAYFTLDKVIAGPLAGLAADFKLLDVFAIYYHAQESSKPNQKMSLIEPYLRRSQALDPKFYDVYRMASSLLAYDANNPKAAVEILSLGIEQRPDIWEIPYYAGFIAHDLLNDDELAFKLMSKVQINQNTPPIVVTLASRFLASSSTLEDAIIFLQSMLFMVPIEYQGGIKQRIKQLEEELNGESDEK